MQFGLSTHLFHGDRLEPRHLELAQRHGFDLVEVFATRTHVDYHDPTSIEALRRAADDLAVSIWSVHAPICDGFRGGHWGRTFSNASTDTQVRNEAAAETLLALRKVCYAGPLVFEVPDHGNLGATLTGLVTARARIQGILEDLSTPFPFEDDA